MIWWRLWEMWYYERLDFLRPCNAWPADSHRFAAGRVIYVVPLCEAKLQKSKNPSEVISEVIHIFLTRLLLRIMVQRVVVPYHPPSGEPVGICRPSVALPQKVQRFVVPHFSQTPPNHRPENLRSRELPTARRIMLKTSLVMEQSVYVSS